MTIQLKLQIRLISASAISAWRRECVSFMRFPKNEPKQEIEPRRTRRTRRRKGEYQLFDQAKDRKASPRPRTSATLATRRMAFPFCAYPAFSQPPSCSSCSSWLNLELLDLR